ncbi:MAG TPA: hypothetical protein VMM18_15475 [Gemmatimonadaceae bacterium]|nr:hypothetical protein [Gemmatimonadaceae bacterium]
MCDDVVRPAERDTAIPSGEAGTHTATGTPRRIDCEGAEGERRRGTPRSGRGGARRGGDREE